MEKHYYLYGLYCPITKDIKYVGITTRCLLKRLNEHIKHPTNFKTKNWINVLILNNLKPEIKLIKEYETYDDLLKSEIDEIKKCKNNGINLFNLTDGGDINPMQGKTHTTESREKISKIQKGRKRTEEEKLRQKENLRRLWNDPYWSEKMKEKFINRPKKIGFHHKEKTKILISQKNKGKKYYPPINKFNHSEETKKKMSDLKKGENNPMYGKSPSKEALLRRSIKVKNLGIYKGKNNPNFKFDITKDELYELYNIRKLSLLQISKYYGCSYQLIVKKIMEFKLKRENNRKKYFFNVDEIKLLLKKGITQIDIAKKYQCSPKILNKFIIKNIKNGRFKITDNQN